ncbi:MAG: ATP-binding protein [Chitinophagaceae bacterium]
MKPFDFGRIADDFYFTNRTKEIGWLKRQVDGRINTMLISPRRWGKSSLVQQVAGKYKKQAGAPVFCFVDIFNIRSEKEFYEELSRQVMRATAGSLEEVAKMAGAFFRKIIPRLGFSPDPATDISVSFSLDDVKKHYSEVLDLPEKIAKKKGKHIVICVDEFQNISFFKDPQAVQKRLRAHWQKHQHVTYVLYGSKRHLLMDFFTKPSMPFYKFGEILFLEKIEEKHWVPFIMERFRATGKSISEELAQEIARLMSNHPYFVQQLAQAAWNVCGRKCRKENIEAAIEELLDQYTILYQKEVDQLTNLQLNFLEGLCAGETNFTSAGFLQTYGIGASGNIRRIKEALENKEIIDIAGKTIALSDPLFEVWLKRRYFI